MRRICPGKDLADSSIFNSIAMSLAVLSITKAKDANGVDIEPEMKYSTGLVRSVDLHDSCACTRHPD